MFWVPLKAMCSNMWASPVIPGTSCAEPTSTRVAKEKTGASGRSTRMNVQPFGSTWTVVLASKSFRSWAAAGGAVRADAAAAAARSSRARTGFGRGERISGMGYLVGGVSPQIYVAARGKFIAGEGAAAARAV